MSREGWRTYGLDRHGSDIDQFLGEFGPQVLDKSWSGATNLGDVAYDVASYLAGRSSTSA